MSDFKPDLESDCAIRINISQTSDHMTGDLLKLLLAQGFFVRAIMRSRYRRRFTCKRRAALPVLVIILLVCITLHASHA